MEYTQYRSADGDTAHNSYDTTAGFSVAYETGVTVEFDFVNISGNAENITKSDKALTKNSDNGTIVSGEEDKANNTSDALAQIEAREKKMQEVMSRFGLTEDEAFAVIKYKTAESYKINAALRDDEAQLNEYQKEIVRLLDSALEKLPMHRGTVYRTVSFDDVFDGEAEYNAFLEEYMEGAVVLCKAYPYAKTYDP